MDIPGKSGCPEGVKLLRANATELAESSRLLVEAGKYGPACSLAVLASEELVKALALALKWFGFYRDTDGQKTLSRLMSQHSPRHDLANATIIIAEVLMMPITDRLEAVLPLADVGAPQEEIEAAKKRSWNRSLKKLLAGSEFDQRLAAIQQFWLHADDLKQMGLYVDRKGSDWSEPRDLSSEDYKEAISNYDYLSKLANSFGDIVEGATSADRSNYEAELKKLKDNIQQSRRFEDEPIDQTIEEMVQAGLKPDDNEG